MVFTYMLVTRVLGVDNRITCRAVGRLNRHTSHSRLSLSVAQNDAQHHQIINIADAAALSAHNVAEICKRTSGVNSNRARKKFEKSILSLNKKQWIGSNVKNYEAKMFCYLFLSSKCHLGVEIRITAVIT